MRHLRLVVVASATTVVAASVLPASAYPRPGFVTRVDVPSNGAAPTSGNNDVVTDPVSISDNGRYVAFATPEQLTPGVLPGQSNVYVRDRATGRTELISTGINSTPAVGPPDVYGSPLSSDPSISGDGRYVAFQSNATNLVVGDTNAAEDVFVYDRQTHLMRRVSVNSQGHQASVAPPGYLPNSYYPSISSNGRFVSFTSYASDLVAGDTNGIPDVFVHDLKTGTTVRVSVASNGQQAAAGCLVGDPVDLGCVSAMPSSSISATGRYVAFDSPSSNLVSGDTNGCYDVFVHDMKTGETTRVSVSSTGAQAVDPVCVAQPGNGSAGSTLTGEAGLGELAPGRSISADGRYVVFASGTQNLIPDEPLGPPAALFQTAIFVHDRQTGRTERIDVSATGAPDTSGLSLVPSISATGRYVTFWTSDVSGNDIADNGGSPNEPEGNGGVMIHDRVTGSTELVSIFPDGWPMGNDAFNSSAVTPDGRWVTFVCEPFKHNEQPLINAPWKYVFVRDRGPAQGVESLGRVLVSRTGTVSVLDPTAESDPVFTEQGASLYGASLTYRPSQRDLFARVALTAMPGVSGTPLVGSPTVLYGLDLAANGIRYEVRVQRLLGPDYDAAGGASFGLFRQGAAGTWTQVASLHGGYGTTGDEVVFALPLRDLGLQAGGRLSGLKAFTAAGSYLTGASQVLDEIALSR